MQNEKQITAQLTKPTNQPAEFNLTQFDQKKIKSKGSRLIF